MDLLSKVRGGSCPEAVLRKLLAACRQPLNTEDGILPTKLYTHRCVGGNALCRHLPTVVFACIRGVRCGVRRILPTKLMLYS